jgi:hypothetical protein
LGFFLPAAPVLMGFWQLNFLPGSARPDSRCEPMRLPAWLLPMLPANRRS